MLLKLRSFVGRRWLLFIGSDTWIRWTTKISSALPNIKDDSIVHKWGKYWEGVYFDYRDVVIDAAADSKTKPTKTCIIIGGLLFLGYCAHENPDEQSFYHQLINGRTDVLLVGQEIRNPISAEYIGNVETWRNQKLLRRLSFGIFSVMWVDNSSEGCGLFREQCTYLRPRYMTFHERIVDVGFLSHWWILKKRMENCDVNPSEWGENP